MKTLEPFALRRQLLVLASAGLAGCDQIKAIAQPGPPLSDEDKALKHKFRGLNGGQLRVDSLFEVNGLNIFDERGKLFFARASFIPPTGNDISSYGAQFGVPKSVRVEWRDRYLTSLDPPEPPPAGHVLGAFRGGTVLGNYTVPVASRIPDDLLDAMRRGVGGFRLKIRIHKDGPLIGWDLSRGFNLQYFAGGDFREADIENGKVLRKGWYIHPKTGQKIETDF
jgi:hypothetical protein